MSDHGIDDISHRPDPSDAPFTEAEWVEFRRIDMTAGKMVGGLMAAIFSIGIVLYSIVLWTVWQ